MAKDQVKADKRAVIRRTWAALSKSDKAQLFRRKSIRVYPVGHTRGNNVEFFALPVTWDGPALQVFGTYQRMTTFVGHLE